MVINYDKLNSDVIARINQCKSYIDVKDAEIKRIEFERDCMLDKYVALVKQIIPFPMLESNKANRIMKYVNEGKNEKEEDDCFDNKHYTEILIKEMNEVDIPVKKFTAAIACGWNTHHVGFEFKVGDKEYRIDIPIVSNTCARDITPEDNAYRKYINTDACKVILYEFEGKSWCKRIYEGYDIDKKKMEEVFNDDK